MTFNRCCCNVFHLLDDRSRFRHCSNSSHVQMMLLATVVYVICIPGIILMHILYKPQPSCLINIFFISWTLVLLQLMTNVSLRPIRTCRREMHLESRSPFAKRDWFTIIVYNKCWWTSTWVMVMNEWLAVCVYSKYVKLHLNIFDCYPNC
uniref:Uncharacterized protein n=1 Tax=Solanum lycopersicum TaxID=4081 RepID=K4CCX4_SOLLC